MFYLLLFRKFHYGIFLILLLFSFQQITFSQGLLNPTSQLKYQNPLPVPTQIDATQGGSFKMYMAQTTQWLGLMDGGGNPLFTTVWGYGTKRNAVTYPGPTFIASENTPVYVKWINNLPGHFLPVDPSLHMAHPSYIHTISDIRDWYASGNVPTVGHLHGGHTESASDGIPEAWFTQNVSETGPFFVKTNYVYDNDQEAATLWYHDHALGITRLNVYAGLAGFYLLQDNRERQLVNDFVLPKGTHDFEIVIQDKSFSDNGELFWPSRPDDLPVYFNNEAWNAWANFIDGEGATLPAEDFPLPAPDGGGPTALAEFFGDFIVVNGMIWPYLDVEPRPYRFRLLNGSDSRFYILEFRDTENELYDGGSGHSFLQIATDDGLLPSPVELTQLIIAPGERAEIVVDFTDFEDNSLYLRNFGPDEPYGGGTPDDDFAAADKNTTGQIMKFNVNKKLKEIRGLLKATVSTTGESTNLRPNLPTLVPDNGDNPRMLGLFEGTDEYGRLQPLLGALNSTKDSIESLVWDDAITEKPLLNSTELWEVYNFTGDAHPVHLHLVAFQIIDREAFDDDFDFDYKDQLQHNGLYGEGQIVDVSSINLSGSPEPPAENEKGWKDTFIVPPGYVGRVIAKFDRLGRYVWHCHILSHEDHEMMRPYEVVSSLASGLANQNVVVMDGVTDYSLGQNYPNPFNPSTTINFSVPTENTLVSLKIYNSIGQEVGTLINQVVPAGNHQVQFDATGLSSGIYFYTLIAGNFVDSKKMIVMK